MMREMIYTDAECCADTQPIIPIKHQLLVETQLHADPPLPPLWTDDLMALEGDAYEFIRAWGEVNRRILRRMRAMMERDGEMPY